jgi:hypothetical protein
MTTAGILQKSEQAERCDRLIDREFDSRRYDSLLFALPLHEGIGAVVMDRLEIF